MNEELFEQFKNSLNFTFSSVKFGGIVKSEKMMFIFFNDFEKRIELHTDLAYNFYVYGELNAKSHILSIDYSELMDKPFTVSYNEKGKLLLYDFTYYSKQIKFSVGDKNTSHSLKEHRAGLFNIERGFQKYIEVIKYTHEIDENEES